MSRFTGTVALVRLILRRDRIRLPIWVLAILGIVYASAQAVQTTYSTPAEIDSYADTMDNSPAAIAMSGPPTALHSVGGVTIFEINTTAMIAIALMAVFLTVRHTRAEEEAGRTELLRSTVVGRHAPTLAALWVVGAACVLVGAAIAAILVSLDLPATGSVVYGASVAALGLVFTAVGVLAAQLTAHARGALGIGSAVVGVSFVLRASGDVGNGVLSWLSPMGWMQAARPFADDRWWPLALLLGLLVVVLAVAAELTTHRDVGSGLLPPRAGPAYASRRLTSAFGLATRLQRGSLVGWIVGMFVGGIAFGSFGQEITSMVEDNPDLAEAFAQVGGTSLVDSYLATVIVILGVIAAGFTISSALRIRSEESAGRVEPLLATGLSRTRWFFANVTFTTVGTVLVVGAAGLGMGIAHAVTSDDPAQLLRLLGSVLTYTPAVLVLGAFAALLIGWLPKAAMAAWAALAACFVVSWLGVLLNIPEWFQRLSPFVHTPEVPVESVNAGPLLVLVVVAVAGAGLGVVGLRHRDVG